MSDYLNRARRYHEAIQAVLLREWDPIGIGDLPEAADEYDGYVGEIYGMLLRHESRQQLTDYLWWIETQHMGLYGNRPTTEAIAARLCEIRSEMERGDAP